MNSSLTLTLFVIICSMNFLFSIEVFDIHGFFQGDWSVSVSRSSTDTHNYLSAPQSERVVLKPVEGTSTLEGLWYTADTELTLSIEFTKPGAGVWYLSDEESDQVQLLAFNFRNHSNGFFISQGPWKKSSPSSQESDSETENTDTNPEGNTKKETRDSESNSLTPQNFYHLTIASLNTFVLNVYIHRTGSPSEIRTYTFWKSGGARDQNQGGLWRTWGTPFLVFLAVLVPRLLFPGPGQLPAHDHNAAAETTANKLKPKKN